MGVLGPGWKPEKGASNAWTMTVVAAAAGRRVDAAGPAASSLRGGVAGRHAGYGVSPEEATTTPRGDASTPRPRGDASTPRGRPRLRFAAASRGDTRATA